MSMSAQTNKLLSQSGLGIGVMGMGCNSLKDHKVVAFGDGEYRKSNQRDIFITVEKS